MKFSMIKINGAKLRAARHASGMTLNRIMIITGISISSIQYYEKNKYRPTYENAEALAKCLNITLGDLE